MHSRRRVRSALRTMRHVQRGGLARLCGRRKNLRRCLCVENGRMRTRQSVASRLQRTLHRYYKEIYNLQYIHIHIFNYLFINVNKLF